MIFMRRNFAILLALVTILPGGLAAQTAANLLHNGDFSERGNGGVLAGWNVGRDSQPCKLEPVGNPAGNKPVLTVTIARAQSNYGTVEQSVKGLAKNTAQLFSLFGLANLFMARRWLLDAHTQVAY